MLERILTAVTQEKYLIFLFFDLFCRFFWIFFSVFFSPFVTLSVVVVDFIGTAAAAAAKSLQLCPTLCDPIDSSPPGSPIPGILQARTLEWVAISFSNA